jgi:hypothetical protein
MKHITQMLCQFFAAAFLLPRKKFPGQIEECFLLFFGVHQQLKSVAVKIEESGESLISKSWGLLMLYFRLCALKHLLRVI